MSAPLMVELVDVLTTMNVVSLSTVASKHQLVGELHQATDSTNEF